MFQSSPDPKAGCNAEQRREELGLNRFNPHPTRRPGATWSPPPFGYGAIQVSILTRPEGRVQPRPTSQAQSLPAGFNPHPTRRPGATTKGRIMSIAFLVSILTRPEGRVQLYRLLSKHTQEGFNPHPTRRPGATSVAPPYMGQCRCFNPHPTRRPGATPAWDIRHTAEFVFQSSPDPKAGCNFDTRQCSTRHSHVSILTRPEGRVQRPRFG